MAQVFGKQKLSDNQVFEYIDTLSLPIPAEAAKKAKLGDPIKVNDIYGVLVTKIGKTEAEIAKDIEAVEAAGGVYVPAAQPTYGLNGPGYASVRVRGGAFTLKVSDAKGDSTDIGKQVYAKETSGVTALTLTKDATSVPFGKVTNAAAKGSAVVAIGL